MPTKVTNKQSKAILSFLDDGIGEMIYLYTGDRGMINGRQININTLDDNDYQVTMNVF